MRFTNLTRITWERRPSTEREAIIIYCNNFKISMAKPSMLSTESGNVEQPEKLIKIEEVDRVHHYSGLDGVSIS